MLNDIDRQDWHVTAEAVLAIFFKDGAHLTEAMYKYGLKREHLCGTVHRNIYDAMHSALMEANSIDIITVKNSLRKIISDEEIQDKGYAPVIMSLNNYENLVRSELGYLVEKLQEYHRKEQTNRLIESAYGMLGGNTKTDELISFLFEGVSSLALQNEAQKSRPLHEHLQEKHSRERDRKRRSGDYLGYKLEYFKDIADKIDGIQPGFYIIGAETNIGKTAFLANLFIDLLKHNPGLCGIYFSLDDNKDVIINRFISSRTGIPLNDIPWKQADPKRQQRIDTEYQELVKASKAGLLHIYDLSDVYDIKTMEMIVRRECQNKKVFVGIDGLYNLDTGDSQKRSGIREENIERANQVKRLVDVYKIPVIATGEVRKKAADKSIDRPPTIHDLMETGKLGYNANLVWILHPKDMEQMKQNNTSISLNIIFEKNKLSDFKGLLELDFERSICRIRPKKDIFA